MKIFFVVIALVLSSQVSLAFDSTEKIIGNNDLVAVDKDNQNIPFKYRHLVNALGKMIIGCTATHIGQGYVLTAGHCLIDTEQGSIKNQNCSTDFDVEWGYRHDAKPFMYSKCQKVIIAERNADVDYALIKVYPIPPVELEVEINDFPKLGTMTTLFSHPEEGPLHWSKRCSIQKISSEFVSKEMFQHVCDTNPGSSGATLIDVNTMKIVGIHNGGYAPNGVGYNYGTYIMNTPLAEILKHLGF